jgi:outer membrane protein assembly factor BamB
VTKACVLPALALFGWLTVGRAEAQGPPCANTHVRSVSLGAGVSTAPVSDAAFNPWGRSFTYVAIGVSLYAIDNATGGLASAWPTNPVPLGSTVNGGVTPVPLVGGGEAIYISGSHGRIYAINANDGSFLWSAAQGVQGQTYFNTVVGLGSCGNEKDATLDTVTAEPTVQLNAFSNTTFRALGVDLVFVPTRYFCGTGGNRIYAINAATGTQQWVFNNFGTQNVNATYDSCYVLYSNDDTLAPPLNNTLICGTEQAGVQNSLWALRTNNGTVAWAINGGRIGSRVQIKPGAMVSQSRIYYGTLDNSVWVRDINNGSPIFPALSVGGSIAMPVWSEFRGPFPGATDMIMFTTADGVFRRVLENTTPSMYLSEAPSTSGRPNGATAGMFNTPPAMFPSSGKVYVGENNSSVQQLEAALGPTSLNSYADLGGGSAFAPTLDFNSYTTSTDIDRLELSAATGNVDRFCVPWGSSSGGDTTWTGIMSEPPDPPQPHACTVTLKGSCCADSDCVGYAPASPCYTVRCNPDNKTCYLDKAPNGTLCDNSNSCDCRPALADASGHCPAFQTPATTCPNGLCDICVDGVCDGANRVDCGGCKNKGDASGCAAGQSCCGAGLCSNLLDDDNNCGACGNACRTPDETCQNGTCRGHSVCKATVDTDLNRVAAASQINDASSLAYTQRGGACDALVTQYIQPGAMTSEIQPGGTIVDTAKSQNTLFGNGVAATFDGKFWAQNTTNTDLKQAQVYDVSTATHAYTNWTISKLASWMGLPFTLNTRYDLGYAANLAIEHLRYVHGKGIYLGEANVNQSGDVFVFRGATDATGVCLVNCTQGAFPQITAITAGVRCNGDGVLIYAEGTNLHVICDQNFTNDGAPCHPGYPMVSNLASPSVYRNTDANGKAYVPITAIYSLATDSVTGSSIYHDIFAEIGGGRQQEDVVIQDCDLHANTGSSIYATVRNIIDYDTDLGFKVGDLKPTYVSGGARIAIARDGTLTRMELPTTAGGAPTFYTGQTRSQ